VPFRKFVLVDTFCAALVIPIFFGASYLFADQIAKWWERFHTAQIVATIVVVCAILVGVYVYLRRRRKRLARELAARLNAEPEMSLAGEQRTPS
jgi:membrane protein DedA with SNARE-associated domain